MEMRRRKDQITTNPLQTADLSQAAGQMQAIARYYDNMTSSFMALADAGIANFTKSMIEDSKSEGAVAGREGAQFKEDEKGEIQSPAGFEKESEIFKWNRAFNQAATTTFQAQTAAQVNGFGKAVAKEANGRMDVYNQLWGKMKTEALSAVTDERQKGYVNAIYDSEYAKNLGTVAGKGVEITMKQTKDAWSNSRSQFSDDLSVFQIELRKLDANEAQIATDETMSQKDRKSMYKQIDERRKLINERMTKRIEERYNEGTAGINIGSLTAATVSANVREDYKKAVVVAEKRRIKERAMRGEEGDAYKYQPDPNLSPRENQEVRAEISKHIADINSEEIVQEKRDERELKQLKRETNTSIKTSIISLKGGGYEGSLQEVSDYIYEAWSQNIITTSDRDAYLKELYNPDEPTRDNLTLYGQVNGNIEDYTIEDISNLPDLTYQTKKKLIDERAKWEADRETFTKQPDYGEGKSIIKGAYGFTEKTIMPEMLTGAKLDKYNEMQRVLSDYRNCVRERVAKGENNISVDCANNIVMDKNEDVKSALYKVRERKRTVTKEDVKRALKRRDMAVSQTKLILQEQAKRFPKDTYAQDVGDIIPQDDTVPKSEGGNRSSLKSLPLNLE
jgi:hypothetical protein